MHVPLSPPLPPAPGRGIYGASLGEMDALVGRIKELADSLGRGSTLLWFTGTAGQRAGGDTGDCTWRRGRNLCLSPALDVPALDVPSPRCSHCSVDGEWSQRGHGGPRLQWVPVPAGCPPCRLPQPQG